MKENFITARNSSGFTLIELLIVIAVLGIILAIAVPTYTDYQLRAGRADAKTKLLEVVSRQERYFSVNNEYSISAEPLANPSSTAGVLSDDGRYLITIASTVVNASRYTGFTAMATPLGGQARDTDCYRFTITSTGVKGIVSNTSSVGSQQAARECWNR